jgi:hypothetical protein
MSYGIDHNTQVLTATVLLEIRGWRHDVDESGTATRRRALIRRRPEGR